MLSRTAAQENNEYECDIESSDEDAFDWIHECTDDWSDEVRTDPLPRGGGRRHTPKRDRAKRDEPQ